MDTILNLAHIYGFLSILVVSLISLVGMILFYVSKDRLKKILPYLVSLSAGALIGDAALHLLPEAFADASSGILVGALILGGFFIFLLLEHVLHWHHSHDGEEEGHDHGSHIGALVSVADAIHNFIDGVIIAISFSLGIEVGLATTIAVILHEVPQEIGDMGLMMYAGWSKSKALFFNFISACFAILGFVIVIAFEASSFFIQTSLPYLLAMAAGGFIYIAVADLIPELRRNHRKVFAKHILVILGGIIAMALLLLLKSRKLRFS